MATNPVSSQPIQPARVRATKIFVSIKSPESTLFEGEARALTSVNDKGVFDILPEHENFISLVKEKIIIYKVDKTKKEFKIEVGIMKVLENKVFILLEVENAL